MRRRWVFARLLAGLVVLVLANGGPRQASAQSRSCSSHQEDVADAVIDKVATWDALRRWQLKYGSCDDGEIAEAVDDTVITLLTHQWDDLMRSAKPFEDSPRLRMFLLRHINEDMNEVDERRIKVSVRGRCWPGNLRLCGRIMDTMVQMDREAH